VVSDRRDKAVHVVGLERSTDPRNQLAKGKDTTQQLRHSKCLTDQRIKDAAAVVEIETNGDYGRTAPPPPRVAQMTIDIVIAPPSARVSAPLYAM